MLGLAKIVWAGFLPPRLPPGLGLWHRGWLDYTAVGDSPEDARPGILSKPHSKEMAELGFQASSTESGTGALNQQRGQRTRAGQSPPVWLSHPATGPWKWSQETKWPFVRACDPSKTSLKSNILKSDITLPHVLPFLSLI